MRPECVRWTLIGSPPASRTRFRTKTGEWIGTRSASGHPGVRFHHNLRQNCVMQPPGRDAASPP